MKKHHLELDKYKRLHPLKKAFYEGMAWVCLVGFAYAHFASGESRPKSYILIVAAFTLWIYPVRRLREWWMTTTESKERQ